MLDLENLTQGGAYDIYIQTNCGEHQSEFKKFTWSQPGYGDTCLAPIVISGLPYSMTGDFTNYGNDYSGYPGINCGVNTASEVLNGYEVVYSYTATEDTILDLSIPDANYLNGIRVLVYTDCEDIGVECYDTSGPGIAVENGVTYYFVIVFTHSNPPTQFTFNLVNYCVRPSNLIAEPLNETEAVISWSPENGETNWSYEYDLFTGVPGTGVTGTVSGTPELTLNDLIPGKYYRVYISADCGDGLTSVNSHKVWYQPKFGSRCEWPKDISSLPYQVSEDLTDYQTLVGGGALTGSCAGLGSLGGYKVIYKYTAAEDGYINIALSSLTSNSLGVLVYEECVNLNSSCIAGYRNSETIEDFDIDLAVNAGQDYFILTSSNSSSESYTYTLDITETLCPKPNNLTVVPTSVTEAEINWNPVGDVSNWEFEYGISGFTLGTGTSGTLSQNPILNLTGLNGGAYYDLYMRSNCGNLQTDYKLISWRQTAYGDTCETPIAISTLPYNTTDDLANYLNDYSGFARFL